MRRLFFIAVCPAIWMISCNKNNSCGVTAVVTQSGTPCAVWGIKVDTVVYPSRNIPVTYRQEGLVVCVKYELYEDMALCACCGGTWADIKSMSPPE